MSNDDVIQGMKTYMEGRELEPEDEQALEREIPRQVVQHNAQGDALEEVEETKHNPVRQPLNVVLVTRGLERLQGEVRRESPADEVRHGRGRDINRVEDGEDDDGTDERIALGDLRALLEHVEERVF